MDDSERPQSNPDAGQPESPTDVSKDTVPAQPATEEQLQQTEQKIEERMSAFERATVRLTKIGVFVGILTLIIFAGQLYEMIEGGKQAEKVITAANTQATAASNFAVSADNINTGIGDAVGKLNDQAGATHDLAVSAGKQADAERSQSITTANELELSQRPWVSAQFSITGPLVRDSEGVHTTIRITPENSGQSPAVKGFYTFAMIPFVGGSTPDKSNPWIVRKNLCDTAERQSATAGQAGKGVDTSQTWFRGENVPVAVTFGMANDEMRIRLCKTKACDSAEIVWPSIYPVIVACVAYRPFFKEAQYHTSFVFDIIRVNPATGEQIIMPDVQGSIPASELRLQTQPFMGVDAN